MIFTRTHIFGYLLTGIGTFLYLVAGLSWLFHIHGTVVWTLVILGFVIFHTGFLGLNTLESGATSEMRQQSSYLQHLLGRVRFLERKEYPPSFTKRAGIIQAIMCFAAVGLISFHSYITDKSLFDSIVLILIGILSGVFIFMAAILKGK